MSRQSRLTALRICACISRTLRMRVHDDTVTDIIRQHRCISPLLSAAAGDDVPRAVRQQRDAPVLGAPRSEPAAGAAVAGAPPMNRETCISPNVCTDPDAGTVLRYVGQDCIANDPDRKQCPERLATDKVHCRYKCSKRNCHSPETPVAAVMRLISSSHLRQQRWPMSIYINAAARTAMAAFEASSRAAIDEPISWPTHVAAGLTPYSPGIHAGLLAGDGRGSLDDLGHPDRPEGAQRTLHHARRVQELHRRAAGGHE